VSGVVSVANLKGGVGKTTTAVHLAAGLALRGREVLIVDLDAQGSATAHLMDPGDLRPGVVEVVRGEMGLDRAVRPTRVPGLSILPWSGEPESADAFPRDPDCLRKVLPGAGGHVVVDTPPHMGASTVAALVASDSILVPVNCEYLPILGLKQFNEALGRIRMKLRIPARVLGYVLTQVDRRERITWEVEEILRKTFGSAVFRTMIRIDTRLKSCPSFRTTAFEFEPESGRARTDYDALVTEFLDRTGDG
jgi:chromosome partitioning protein